MHMSPTAVLQAIGLVVVIALLIVLIVQLRKNAATKNVRPGQPATGESHPAVNLQTGPSDDLAASVRPALLAPDLPSPRQGDDDRDEQRAAADAGVAEALGDSARLDASRLERVELEHVESEHAAEAAARAEAAHREKMRAEAAALILDAKAEATAIRDRVRDETQQAREGLRSERVDLDRREQRLTEREDRLDIEHQQLHQQRSELDARAEELVAGAAELAEAARLAQTDLERIAGLSADAARVEVITAIEAEAKLAAGALVRDIERQAQAGADVRARKIITGAIQRLASEQTAESVVSVLHLPNDEMKGRIIGREGRNVRTFEQITGVNLIIDDTPEAVLISCFDPVRREVARVALEALVLDGRIHPQRIEEVYERSHDEVERMCLRAGEDAVLEMGIADMHPELVKTIGHLKYRTSYGQNVLAHLIECGHLAAMMAAELGLDIAMCRRAAFLHDIGKALTHEVEGSHALIGAELARRYGETEDIAHAIEAHHNEVEVRTVEAVLTQAADAISGGRPGARRESLEAYVKRLQRLEEIARAHDGVDRVFAMQAGREVRVMVMPDVVDDIAASVLAREIAKQVEEELTYPGQIRVTVVRESRATEVAR
jgi:ribonuclease Y